MKAIRTLGILMLFALTFSALHRTARADDWDKKTTVTFSDSVQLPGIVLQPGTYVFKLAESPSNRNIVEVFDQDQSKLITTVMTVPDYRLQPRGETTIRYAERPGDQPPALEAWFYPGEDYGQQFVYPKSESQQLSQVNNTQVPSAGSDQVATPEASTPQAAPAEQNLTAQADTTPAGTATTPAPAPQSEPTTSTTPANAQTTDQDATLPKTASVTPLVGLVGLCLIATALVLRRKAHA